MTDERTRNTVFCDRWNRDDLAAALKGDRALRRARKGLADATPAGGDALDDVWLALYKAAPQLVPLSDLSGEYVVNRFVLSRLMELPQFRRLRYSTMRDALAASAACVSLRHTLATLFERLAFALKTASFAEQVRAAWLRAQDQVTRSSDALDEAVERWMASGFDPSMLDELKQIAQDLTSSLASSSALKGLLDEYDQDVAAALEREDPELRVALSEALGDIADGAAREASTARAWGLTPGHLQRLDPSERLEWAKRLRDDRLVQIADLFGRMENVAFSEFTEHVPDVFEEVADLTLGGDLERATPAELLLLADPATEPDFLARWADGELVCYDVDGGHDAGRGGIVMCLDTSLSMAGPRELFGKALMLVLLHTARRQGRAMHVIHFGYRQTTLFSFVRPADFTAERILEAAAMFWGSGTDFEAPMIEALELLEAEHAEAGRVRSDIVFVTDDECFVEDGFLRNYLERLDVIGGRTWGVLVDPTDVAPDGPLWQMSEGRVFSAKDLTSGRDVASVLGGLR